MANRTVVVAIVYDDETYMQQMTQNDILPENVPAAARLLMDGLYLRLDDQVSVAKLRTHRRRLRDKHREQAGGRVAKLGGPVRRIVGGVEGGRDGGFDPQSDPIVRIQAVRLRRALNSYCFTNK